MKDNRKEGAIKNFHHTKRSSMKVRDDDNAFSLLSASITSQADKWSSFWLSLCPALYIRRHKADIAGSSERTIISVISTTLARCWEDHQQRRKTVYHSSVITSCSRLAASATPCTTSVVMCLADRVIDKRSRPLLTSQRKTVQWPNAWSPESSPFLSLQGIPQRCSADSKYPSLKFCWLLPVGERVGHFGTNCSFTEGLIFYLLFCIKQYRTAIQTHITGEFFRKRHRLVTSIQSPRVIIRPSPTYQYYTFLCRLRTDDSMILKLNLHHQDRTRRRVHRRCIIEHSDSRFESIHRFILNKSIRIDSFCKKNRPFDSLVVLHFSCLFIAVSPKSKLLS